MPLRPAQAERNMENDMKPVVLLVALLTATSAQAERANNLNFFCGANGGFKTGECGFMAGCLISEAIGGFDCYQQINPSPEVRLPYVNNPLLPSVIPGNSWRNDFVSQ